MVEVWFYTGRLGNCMFLNAFAKIVSDCIGVPLSIPKGTEITGFPNIHLRSRDIEDREGKFVVYPFLESMGNPKTLVEENDNMVWFIEPNFTGSKISGYRDMIKINDVISHPDIYKKWIVLLGNYELGENYHPYRMNLKRWFKFPEIDLSKFEFFKLHPDLGSDNWFIHHHYEPIHSDDMVISLRLEDYTTNLNEDRLLDYDYFRIILDNTEFRKLYIITNPGSIGHNDQYKYLKEFNEYDPTIVRVYDPVMSMAYGSKFNNIAISQSTYSWWLAFLSNADNIYYPISKVGPFSLTDEKYKGTDLRVPSSDFKYVDYDRREIMRDAYKFIDYESGLWIG